MLFVIISCAMIMDKDHSRYIYILYTIYHLLYTTYYILLCVSMCVYVCGLVVL